jgi:hypothetical protein
MHVRQAGSFHDGRLSSHRRAERANEAQRHRSTTSIDQTWGEQTQRIGSNLIPENATRKRNQNTRPVFAASFRSQALAA